MPNIRARGFMHYNERVLGLGIGYLVLKDQGAFNELTTPHYYPSNYNPGITAPQDAIRPQNQLKDSFRPIYIQH